MFRKSPPKTVRVSLGSAAVLGLISVRLDAEPTTAYLLTYSKNKCTANCAFCPQAKNSKGGADMLSRVNWPTYPTKDVILGINKAFQEGRIKRVCIQALNYPGVIEDLLYLVKEIRKHTVVPISVSCQPLTREDTIKLIQAGVNRVSIALDASTKELFEKIKGSLNHGPYFWETHLRALEEATEVFGRGSVTTHLIVGLGESEEDIIRMIQWCVDKGIYPSLFAFTPIPGTMMEDHPEPMLDSYRRVQIAQYLITHSIKRYENMKFEKKRLVDLGISGKQLMAIVETGEPFRTSGCQGCNRPYYNERPGGPIYNYPRKPSEKEIEEIKKQIGIHT